MDVREVMEEIRKDRVFYEHSHGGVTFSGGEPLMQKEFLLELLKTCRAEGIHTAVETTGFLNTEVLREVMPYVELFLYDVKAMDPEVHRSGPARATRSSWRTCVFWRRREPGSWCGHR